MKTNKRILSVLLCLIMLTAAIAPGITASAADECTCGKTPIVYIKGRTNIYKTTDDITDGNLAETNFSGGQDAVIETTANILPAFAMALITDEWDDYCDVLYEEIIPIYDQYKLSNDGEIDNESGINPYWSLESIISRVKSAGRNGHKNNASWAQYMQFQYDMRLDPCVNAKDLHEYIEVIKDVTGHDKVSIISRCEGTVIANAYFNIYGYDSVESTVIYNAISNGAEIADDVYSNKVVLNPDALNRFISQFIDSSPVLDFVKATVNLATFNGLLEGGTDFIESIYNKISANLMPRLIRAIFGTCPGWWGMISPEAYEECKAFVLNDNEDGKYDKLIEKIDNYNYNYKVNARNILEEMQAAGVNVYIIAKYGDQMYPVIENYDTLGDGVVSLYKQTFSGATTSKITDTLPESYIAERTASGFGDYISADSMVDASTAPLYEHTWYFKDLDHHIYPADVDTFMVDLIRYNGYADINTFEDRPQFMYFEYLGESESGAALGNILPLTEENKDVTTDTTDISSIYIVLIKFLTAMFNFFTALFNGTL